jgi:hypothetical protein
MKFQHDEFPWLLADRDKRWIMCERCGAELTVSLYISEKQAVQHHLGPFMMKHRYCQDTTQQEAMAV